MLLSILIFEMRRPRNRKEVVLTNTGRILCVGTFSCTTASDSPTNLMVMVGLGGECTSLDEDKGSGGKGHYPKHVAGSQSTLDRPGFRPTPMQPLCTRTNCPVSSLYSVSSVRSRAPGTLQLRHI